MTRRPSSARTRLETTAAALFHRHGVAAVGIDTVIAAADVARMTLYNNYGDKDGLLLAAFNCRAAVVLEHLGQARDWSDLFDRQAALSEAAAGRGCFALNLAAELPADHPVLAAARAHKTQVTGLLTVLLTRDGLREDLAPALSLLLNGAIALAQLEGGAGPFTAAKAAAAALLQSSPPIGRERSTGEDGAS